jgi:heptaprenyl diphosphate synthase
MTDRVQHLARLALLLALATVIHAAEALLPSTILWFRFGFANIIGLATLELFGFKDALFLTLARIVLGSLLSGLFGSPAFILSLAGGTCAILSMGLVHRVGNGVFSEIGISVAGAVCHNAAQLFAAYLILIKNEAVLLLLPVMILTAIATGVINGLAARFFVQHYRRVTEAAA